MKKIVYIVILFLLPLISYAESNKSYFNQEIKGINQILQAKIGDDFIVTANTPEGIHRFRLKRIRNSNSPLYVNKKRYIEKNRPKLFQGEILRKKSRKSTIDGVSADIFNNILTINFFGNKKRVFRLKKDLLNKDQIARLTYAPMYLPISCASEPKKLTASSFIKETSEVVSSLKAKAVFSPNYVADLAVDADSFFYQQNGSSISNTNAAIDSIINSVNSIYLSQIGVNFQISQRNIFTNTSEPYNTDQIDELLDTLTFDRSDLQGDLKHLFTGRVTGFANPGCSGSTPSCCQNNFDTCVVGFAYLGDDGSGTCSSFNTGVSEMSNELPSSFRHIIVAHEIGHNFSAEHTATGVMAGSLNLSNPPNSFSSFSVGQITSFVSNHGTCLSIDGELDLKINRSKKQFASRFSTINNLSACEVSLYASRSKNILSGSYQDASLVLTLANGPILDETIRKRVRKVRRVSTKALYFRALASCGSTVFESPIRKMKRNLGDGKAVKPKTFIRHLTNRYASS